MSAEHMAEEDRAVMKAAETVYDRHNAGAVLQPCRCEICRAVRGRRKVEGRT